MRKLQKSKRFFSLAIKIIVLVATISFIYFKIDRNLSSGDVADNLNRLITDNSNFGLIGIIFLFAIINWSIEGIKWRFLAAKVERLSFINALASTLAGVTISVFTPNRTGEYLGRMLYIKEGDRIKAAILSMVGSFGQLVVTLFMGVVTGLVLIGDTRLVILSKEQFYYLLMGATTLCITLLWCYINLNYIVKSMFSVQKKKRKWVEYIKVFGTFKPKEINYVLLLSTIRYIVYCIQFYLMLKFCDVSLSLFEASTYIPLTYFGVTVIPSIALAELGIREALSIELIGSINDNLIGIVTASFFIWVVNIALPAVVGSIFILRSRIIK